MLTIQNLIDYVAKKELDYDFSTNILFYKNNDDIAGTPAMARTYFGYSYGKGVWYWFETFLLNTGDNPELNEEVVILQMRYSMNSGKTSKARKHFDNEARKIREVLR